MAGYTDSTYTFSRSSMFSSVRHDKHLRPTITMANPKAYVFLQIFLFFVLLLCCISGVSGDVPDDVVYTDLHKTVYEGDSVVLTCRFRGAPLAVWWKKGDDPKTAPNLVSWIPSDNVTGKCEGERPCQIMEMNEDHSLVIKEVSIAEQGRYICRVTIKGILIHNFTDIIVFSPPTEPFPTIDQCPTGPDDRGTEPCILTQETGADSTELTCRTMEKPGGVVSLSWTLGGTTVPLQAPQRSTNPDGMTEDVMVAIYAMPSADPYVCVAILPTTTRRQATMSVTLNTAQIVTTIEAVTAKNDTFFPPEPINKHKTAIIISTVCALSVIILIIIPAVFIWRRRKGIYKRLNSDQRYNEGPVSYLELWELVEMCAIFEADGIVSKLVGNPKGESEYHTVRSQADLYSELCEWKDKCTGDVRTRLYAAIEDPKKIKDLRALTDKMVSLDDHDLEHICWHVQSCKKTVQPVLRALYPRNENITKFRGDTQTSGNSRSDVIRDDLQLMKTWKKKSKSANPEGEGETVKTRQPTSRGIWCCWKLQTSQDAGDNNERTPMYSAGSEYVDLGAETLPPNQMVQVCLALEEAGRRANESDTPVYHQLAKTFFQIKDEYKSDLTGEVLKEFALSITERHCQRLGNTLKLSAKTLATRNEEDLEMFGADGMLKEWVMDQKCSNYEIRRKLRQAAEQCNRQDIAGNFISKEQNEVMTSTTKLPACVTITNEKQSSGASASGSISAISRDELDRIGRCTGSSVLLEFCSKYGVTDIPGQQSPGGKELLFETKIINVLKPKLDSEHEKFHKDALFSKKNPREILRQLFPDKYSHYVCLLAAKKSDDIFNVELIDLAFRLIMADVHPFAKALNISDQVLTHYRRNLGPHNLRQGTVKFMQEVNTDDRLKMARHLKQAGYSEEARAIVFGFEISFGDVIAVENRVDKAKLAKQLGVSDDVHSTDPVNQRKDDTLHQSVLVRWRDPVRSSTFNHRLVLADALFRMEEEQLSLDIISGVYRKRVIDNPVSERLAATIPETEMLTLSKILNQKVKNGQKCQDVIIAWVAEKKLINLFSKSPKELSNELLGAGFYAFAHEIMAGAWKVDKKAGQKEGKEIVKAATEELHPESNPINENGEKEGKEEKEDMEKAPNGDTSVDNTGARNLDKKAGQTEGTETGNAAIENVHQKGTPTDKQGEKNGKVEKEETDEEKNGDPLENNTDKKGPSQNEDKKSPGKEAKDSNVAEISKEENPSTKAKGAKHGKESDKAPEEEASLNNNGTDGEQDSLDDDFEHVSKEDVVQEMSRDGAAESRENTTENVDTMEQGNTSDGSDEHRREESSETPLQVKAISRTQAFS